VKCGRRPGAPGPARGLPTPPRPPHRGRGLRGSGGGSSASRVVTLVACHRDFSGCPLLPETWAARARSPGTGLPRRTSHARSVTVGWCLRTDGRRTPRGGVATPARRALAGACPPAGVHPSGGRLHGDQDQDGDTPVGPWPQRQGLFTPSRPVEAPSCQITPHHAPEDVVHRYGDERGGAWPPQRRFLGLPLPAGTGPYLPMHIMRLEKLRRLLLTILGGFVKRCVNAQAAAPVSVTSMPSSSRAPA